jgi:TolA-binding protein
MQRRLAMVTTLAALLVLVLGVAPVSALDEADRLFMVGERALADRFYPVARRSLERFVAQYPADPRLPRASLMLGKARLALNDSQSALEALTRAESGLTEPAELLEAKFWRAESLYRLKQFAEARSAYDEIVKTDAASPLAPNALYGFAWSERELKNPAAAANAFREFITAWPQHENAASATLELARVLVELKRTGEAQPLLSGFAGKYPGSRHIGDAQFLLAWTKVTGGDPQGGLKDLNAFVAANPGHAQVPEAQKLIAQVAGKHGSPTQMQQAYKALMDQTPASAEALFEAAEIGKRRSNPKEVDAAWRKLRAQFPDHALTRQLAGDLAASAFKQKNYKDAAALAQIAAQSSESSARADAWLIVGESELQLKRFPEAAKAFESVSTAGKVEDGTRYRALAGLGLAREQQKQYQAALAAYEVVAARSPDTTLRDWARERVAAMKTQLKPNGAPAASPRRPEPAKPTDKPAGRKP